MRTSVDIDTTSLRQAMVGAFSLDDLKQVCADLGIDFDDVPGEPTKPAKSRELIALCRKRGRLDDLLAILERERPLIAWRSFARSPDLSNAPYKGLQYFGVDDHDLFFGREALTAELIKRLRDPAPSLPDDPILPGRLLAVVGASGSGKSSVVRAGLVAALMGKRPPPDGATLPEGCDGWRVHIVTPTAKPLESLAVALTREAESVTAAATLGDDLARDARSLHLYARRLVDGRTDVPPAARRLLLVVDQFEELFTQCRDAAERQLFVDNLLTAVARETAGPMLVVLTLRADFYHKCADFDRLRLALERHQAFIGAMNAAELREAIEQPAELRGLRLEPGLADLILQDAGDERGLLPLLSHALLETWRRRSGADLTLRGYREAGGLRGAIAETANRVYGGFSPSEQAIARRVFLALTELGEGTQDTRRRASRAEVIPRPEDEAEVEAVLQALADARLVTTHADGAEVAHEALIRVWPALRAWLEESREVLRLQRQVQKDSEEWEKSGGDASFLYGGSRLARAEDALTSHWDELTERARSFIQASRDERAREERERQDEEERREAGREERVRREAQVAAERRGRRVAVGLAVVALAAAAVAGWQWRETRRLGYLIRANELANKADLLSVDDLHLASLLGLESDQAAERAGRPRYGPSESTLRQLRDRMSGAPIITSMPLKGHGNSVRSVAFSPDGKWLATGSEDNTARLWRVGDAADPEPVVLKGHDDYVWSVAFSPDGKWLATGSEDTTARLWHTDPEEGIRSTCAVVGRNLTRKEWDQYFPDEAYRKTCPQWPLDGESN